MRVPSGPTICLNQSDNEETIIRVKSASGQLSGYEHFLGDGHWRILLEQQFVPLAFGNESQHVS